MSNLEHRKISQKIDSNFVTDKDLDIEFKFKIEENLVNILESLANENINESLNNSFLSNKTPSITLKNYLKRIIHYTEMQPSTLIISLIYMDSICSKKGFKIITKNIHRFLFTALVIAMKFNEDNIFLNSDFSKIGGFSLEEMNKMERKFLKLIDFKLFVDQKLYRLYEKYLNA